MIKKKKQKRNKPFIKKLHSTRGKAEVSIILFFVAVMGALFFTGGFFNERKNPYITPTPTLAVSQNSTNNACCDNDACEPSTTKKLTYGGTEYGLLKSHVKMLEGSYHLKEVPDQKDPEGNPIVINTSSAYTRNDGGQFYECGNGAQDQLYGADGKSCVPIPDDELVYVCKENCNTVPDQYNICGNTLTNQYMYNNSLFCYGNKDSIFDVYFRLSDFPTPGVPDVIKSCNSGVSNTATSHGGEFLVAPTNTAQQSINLSTFKVVQVTPVEGASSWTSPYCKPAIYLYPEQKTDLTVQIKPDGKLTLTIPSYPKDGWKVTAYPNGQITSDNTTYPYLYYEAELPDNSYTKPSEGFVFNKNSLSKDLTTLLTKLGLNDKERSEFVSYWVKSLPKSDYYFVGIIPQSTLDSISPLTFSQKPNTVIRITLYFEALDKNISVKNPTFTTPTRNGFTVVEWGGIFKRDKDHPFSCYM